MTSTPKFAHVDTKKPNGFYVQFECVMLPDDCSDAPDQRSDGFWPSKEPDAAGYVGESNYADEMAKAEERMAGWKRGDWYYVGVRARLSTSTARACGVSKAIAKPTTSVACTPKRSPKLRA
jgi:hypothetical protein